jgi:hypothetical protein
MKCHGIPEQVSPWPACCPAAWLYHDPNYLSFREFAHRLVADTSVLTQDPSQASLFFVPALAYYYSDNTGDPAPQVLRVIKWVTCCLHACWLGN